MISPDVGLSTPVIVVQRRRLAGAVVADEADELALVDLDREALDGGDPSVVDPDVTQH